jgi:hypothetical protein
MFIFCVQSMYSVVNNSITHYWINRSDVNRISDDTFVGCRYTVVYIQWKRIKTFSTNYKKANSDFSNQMKSSDQIYG